MDQLYLVGLVQAIFFVLLILSKKQKRLSDYLLSFFIFLLGGNLLFVYCAHNQLLNEYPLIIIFDIFYWVLLGPSLYLYSQLVTTGKNRFQINHLFLLIPVIIITIGFSNFIFGNAKDFFFAPQPESWIYKITFYVWMYNSPIFYILIIVLLKKHSKRIRQYYSYSKNVDLKWLYFLSNGFAVFLFFLLFSSYIRQLFHLPLPSSFQYTWLVMVIYIFGIGLYGYKQKGVFTDIENSSIPIIFGPEINKPNILMTPKVVESSVEKEKIAYEKSGLNKEEAERLSHNLQSLMEKDRPYLDSEMDLTSLAKILCTTTHNLSQVINEYFGKNFYEFINEYRIEEAKKLLLDSEFKEYKIIVIALECGFNSKSTFYNLFKKSTSLTPAEYRMKHTQKVESLQ